MIKSFKHKGLKKFFETGKTSGIQAQHANKLKKQLLILKYLEDIKSLDLLGFNLHQLTGERRNIWSIKVNKNWRLTFEFENSDVHILNYEDYH